MSIFSLKFKPTQRDTDILTILWNSDHSMTASQIAEASPTLTVNTVQAVLRKLLKYKLIQVAEIVYSGTVLSRSYLPTISAEDYALAQLTMEYQKFEKQVSISSVFAALLDLENNPEKKAQDVKEIEKILSEYKNQQK